MGGIDAGYSKYYIAKIIDRDRKENPCRKLEGGFILLRFVNYLLLPAAPSMGWE